MRIMQLYRIENEYKQHKKRLESIKKLNSKEKIIRLTSQHFNITNQLKKIKTNAETFHEKEESSRREQDQERMNQTITDNFKKIKQQYESLGTFGKIPAGPKSLPKFQQSKIEHENNLLKEKIGKIKSVYKPYRRNSQYQTLNPIRPQRQRVRRTQKQKLLEMLKTQFKLQPRVIFPPCKSRNAEVSLQQGSSRQSFPRKDDAFSTRNEQKAPL